jgi:hypothetical protein
LQAFYAYVTPPKEYGYGNYGADNWYTRNSSPLTSPPLLKKVVVYTSSILPYLRTIYIILTCSEYEK